MLEQRIAFAFEVSVLAVRGQDGKIAFYDVPRNTHADGILRRSVVPSGMPPAFEEQARAMAGRVADALSYVGVLAVEMFWLGPDAAAAAADQRDRTARSQLRSLDHGRLRCGPVRKPYPGNCRLAAGPDRAPFQC